MQLEEAKGRRIRRRPSVSLPEMLDLRKFQIQYSDLQFEEIIGVGASGQVSRGVYRGQKVAIKKLFNETMDAQAQEGYLGEVTVLATLQHRFLLPFVGYTTQAPFCIITKFISGGSLFTAIHDKNSLSKTEKNVILYGIATGMQYLHEKSVIHRDLKPPNILLDSQKMPIICDFGSSRACDDDSHHSARGGTPQYMAPEFLQAQKYNEKVDVYSFGVIMWEMITGEIPFGDLLPAQIIYQVLVEKRSLPIPNTETPELQQYLADCLDFNPVKRPTFKAIAQLFQGGHLSLEGSDQRLFERSISVAKSRHFRVSSSYSVIESPIGSYSTQVNPWNPVNPNQLIHAAQFYLDSMNRKSSKFQVEVALDFFETYAETAQIMTLDLWNPWLLFYSTCTREIEPRVRHLLEHFGRVYEILSSITKVPELHRYVKLETLDLFLFIATYVPQAVSPEVVARIIELVNYKPQNAIILLTTVLKNETSISHLILQYFKDNVMTFSNLPTGHILLHALTQHQMATEPMIRAYGTSPISDNCVAAYESLMLMGNGKPELFQLSAVLAHMNSSNKNLRAAALEFIRKFGVNPDGIPLNQITLALIDCAINYNEEKAVWLTCRIASDPKKVRALMIPQILAKWLIKKPARALLLMPLFLVVIQTTNLLALDSAIWFLDGAMETKNDQLMLSACLAIGCATQLDQSRAYQMSGILKEICQRVSKFTDPKSIEIISNVFVVMTPLISLPEYNEVVVWMMKTVAAKNSAWLHCVAGLSYLARRHETHDTFLEANVVAVLGKLDSNEAASPYVRKIFRLLHESGTI